VTYFALSAMAGSTRDARHAGPAIEMAAVRPSVRRSAASSAR